MLDVILKRFESPDETRLFEKGKFEIVHIGKSVTEPRVVAATTLGSN